MSARRIAAAVAICTACGRVNFARVPPDGARDGAQVDAPPACAFGPFGAPQIVAGVNSTADDWSPDISHDGLSLYFYTQLVSSPGEPDVWRATRPDRGTTFGAPQVVVEVSNVNDDWSPRVSADQLVLVFVSFRAGMAYELFEATRATVAAPFATPVARAELNTTGSESHVDVSGDGLRVVFTSNRAGLGYDLYSAERPARGMPFGNLQSLVALNSGADEMTPALSADELEIFFVSNRTGGPGKLDVWRAQRAARTEPWGAPEPVIELGTARDEFGLSLSSDGTELYLGHDTDVTGGTNAEIKVAARSCL